MKSQTLFHNGTDTNALPALFPGGRCGGHAVLNVLPALFSGGHVGGTLRWDVGSRWRRVPLLTRHFHC